jgi:phage shock protein E
MKPNLFAIVLALLTAAAAFAVGQAAVNYEEPAALEKLVEGKSHPYFLVDVRTPEEYASGHIPTAVNIPNTEIGSRPPTADTSALIIVYCRSGNRSGAAQKVLQAMGYRNVINFGPLSKWEKPLVMGDAPTAP